MLHVRHEVALGRLQACLLALGASNELIPPHLFGGACICNFAKFAACLLQGGLDTSERAIACLTLCSIYSVTQ